jgi:hypothetical protein
MCSLDLLKFITGYIKSVYLVACGIQAKNITNIVSATSGEPQTFPPEFDNVNWRNWTLPSTSNDPLITNVRLFPFNRLSIFISSQLPSTMLSSPRPPLVQSYGSNAIFKDAKDTVDYYTTLPNNSEVYYIPSSLDE